MAEKSAMRFSANKDPGVVAIIGCGDSSDTADSRGKCRPLHSRDFNKKRECQKMDECRDEADDNEFRGAAEEFEPKPSS